jgi:predicted ribosome quality control (RQC) complex YloA/Tae2 family protein
MKQAIISFENIVDDIIYYIGTSASDNFDVIDMGEANDYWFHANNGSSCHVVAKVPKWINNKHELKTILKRGALLCKQHTNKLSKCNSVEIVYCQMKNVMKTDVPGLVEFTDGKIMVV